MKKNYLIINYLNLIGKKIINLIINIGNAGILLKQIILNSFIIKREKKVFIKHIYFIGVLSLGIIIISGLFIGMVVGLQGYHILKKFGTEEIIGQMTALSIIRELGPVISALLFIGRTGTSLTAEMCVMKSTDQIASMEMMGIDPIKKLITPRFFASIVSMIFLSIIFITVSILGSYLSTVSWLGVDSNMFWISIKENIDFKIDILNAFIKSIIFGFIITWISIFQGLTSNPTAEGTAISTTNTVVYSTFVILFLNFFLTAIMFK